MGSIRARKDTSKLFLDFRFNGVRCRELTLLDDNYANRKKLQTLLNRIESSISAGTFNYAEIFPNSQKANLFKNSSGNSNPEFSWFVIDWWEENAFRWKKSTHTNTKNILDKHLLPRFGDLPVQEINKSMILKFRAELSRLPGRSGKLLSNKRINNIMQPFQSIMDEASERFNFPSPFKNIKRLPIVKSQIEPFTLAEVIELIQTVNPHYRSYLIVRFFTGMRTGEINGLRWKNVNLDALDIYVCESFTYNEMTSTKTNEVRFIKMNSMVTEAILHQKSITQKYSEYVFCNRMGEPMDNANFTNRIWYPLLTKVGLAPRRPYQTRHTAATLWLAAGENPEWVANQLGHSSTQMLFQTYSRFIPNATRNDGSAIESLLSTTIKKKKEDNKND